MQPATVHAVAASTPTAATLDRDEQNGRGTVYWLGMLLRGAVGLCFIGHGAFGLITKAAWLPYFGVIGIEPALAWRVMPVIGMLDISVGLAILFRPATWLLAYATFWCLCTAALRPIAGESVWEMLERAGNYGPPLALLLLGGAMQRNRHTTRNPPAGTQTTADTDRLRLAFTALRWTTVLLLLGHGALMMGSKSAFVAHWSVLGVPGSIVPWIGGLEIMLAGAVALRPGVALLLFVCGWKVASETLWMAAGDPVWEWIERAGSYAAPAGAALLAWTLASRREQVRPCRPLPRGRSGSLAAASRMIMVTLGALLTPAVLDAQLPAPGPEVLAELRRGGMVLACRHALTDHSARDANVDFANPLTQRQLNAEGEAQARELGRLIAALRIPIADVYASPYQRNVKSAELAFGKVQIDPALLTRGDPARRRELLTGAAPGGGNRVIMTHERTLHSDLPTLARGTIGEGTCIVVRRLGAEYSAIAQALPADWLRLLETHGDARRTRDSP